MSLPLRIAPSVLSADFAVLGQEVEKVEAAGADLIHIDVMDGHFVPNITVGPLVVTAVRKAARGFLDVHLMIEEPDRYLTDFAVAGADGLTVHVEACRHLHRTIGSIRALGKKAGVALNPATPLSSLDHVRSELDMVLLMTVNPGFGGQTFIPSVLPKIAALRSMAPTLDIEVDGGIKVDNVLDVVQAGANVIVSGSGIFGTPDYRATIAAMRNRCAAL